MHASVSVLGASVFVVKLLLLHEVLYLYVDVVESTHVALYEMYFLYLLLVCVYWYC